MRGSQFVLWSLGDHHATELRSKRNPITNTFPSHHFSFFLPDFFFFFFFFFFFVLLDFYICRLKAGGCSRTEKIVLLKNKVYRTRQQLGNLSPFRFSVLFSHTFRNAKISYCSAVFRFGLILAIFFLNDFSYIFFYFL